MYPAEKRREKEERMKRKAGRKKREKIKWKEKLYVVNKITFMWLTKNLYVVNKKTFMWLTNSFFFFYGVKSFSLHIYRYTVDANVYIMILYI